MEIQVNELYSKVKATDSRYLLDPAVLREIVHACVRAVKDEMKSEKLTEQDRKLGTTGSHR